MHKHNESQLNLRFLKTFAMAAERLVTTANCSEPQKAQFSSYAKTLSEVYPALENLAWELKLHYGSDVELPEIEETEVYEKSAAFPVLAKAIAKDMRERFPNIRSWYDGRSETVPQQLDAAVVNMQASDAKKKNSYWLQNSLKLSLSEIEAKRLELQQQMYDEIENRLLPQQVAGIMESQGFQVSDEQDDEIAEILCEVGEQFLTGNKQADSNEVALSVWDKLQENWNITDREQRILWPLVKPMESLGRVIRDIQKKMVVWETPARYLDKQLKNMDAIPGDEDIFREIYHFHVINPTQERLPQKTWADGEVLPDYLEPYQNDETFKKINSQSIYWKRYEQQGKLLLNPEFQEKFKAVVGDWSLALREETGDYKSLLVKKFGENKKRREAEEDGDIVAPINRDDERQIKENQLIFANRLAVAAQAAEKYAGVRLNDSGVTQKTLAKISTEKEWTENDFQALYLITEAFENNYDMFQNVLSVSIEGDNEAFLDNFLALPHSPEKREMMKLMLLAFNDQRLNLTGEAELLRDDFIELIEEEHLEATDNLKDFAASGIELYPEMRGLSAESLADELNYQISGDFILPLYMNLKPFPNAKEKILGEIEGYDHYRPEAKAYLEGLVEGFRKEIEPVHRQVKSRLGEVWRLNAGSLDEEFPLANVIKDYKELLLRDFELRQNNERVQEVYQGENALYQKYLKYREEREKFNISDKSLQMMLMQAQSWHR